MGKPSRRWRTGRVVLPAEAMSASLLAAGRVTAGAGLPVVLTTATFIALVKELGGAPEAWALIARLAVETRKPVFVNGPRQDGRDGSRTVAIPPPDWTAERLAGFVAGYKDELAELFGEMDGVPEWPGGAA